ncbi:hypothetical protein WJU23_14435, partial [Prosthecobacter sp. SYSU 5D2]|uniref:hypothetical protein n=1 Tax=Prosthecobacter sp. SYSU 5D2 TaxID=3134134 RepID=UPI0031FE4703
FLISNLVNNFVARFVFVSRSCFGGGLAVWPVPDRVQLLSALFSKFFSSFEVSDPVFDQNWAVLVSVF